MNVISTFLRDLPALRWPDRTQLRSRATCVAARNLKIGDDIRLDKGHYSKICSIDLADNHLIVGGPFNKTATALRIRTIDGHEILVHPGQAIGISDCTQLSPTTAAG